MERGVDLQEVFGMVEFGIKFKAKCTFTADDMLNYNHENLIKEVILERDRSNFFL